MRFIVYSLYNLILACWVGGMVLFTRKNGLLGFTAQVLMENRQMLQLFEKMGFSIEKRMEAGVYELTMSFRD